jgi:hypothetical protein
VHFPEVVVARYQGSGLEPQKKHATAIFGKESERLERLSGAEGNPGNSLGVEGLRGGFAKRLHRRLLSPESCNKVGSEIDP